MVIRKIVVGLDYMKGMNYVVRQPVLDGYRIDTIRKNLERDSIEVWVEKNNEILLWKEFSHQVPIHIEYNIDI